MSHLKPPPIAVYDACVLYPNFLRDVLMRLGVARLVRARWTDTIHDEWIRNLRVDRPHLDPATIERTRQYMASALPDARVQDYEALMPSFAAINPNDRHVAAAAARAVALAGADGGLIVTNNLKHFPDPPLAQAGLEVINPDMLLVRLLESDAETLRAVLERHRRGLRRPALTPEE